MSRIFLSGSLTFDSWFASVNAIGNRDLRTWTNHFGSVHFVVPRIVFFCPGPKFLIRDLQPRFLLRIVILRPGQNTSVARIFRFSNRIFFVRVRKKRFANFTNRYFRTRTKYCRAINSPKNFCAGLPPSLILFSSCCSPCFLLRSVLFASHCHIVISSLFIEQQSARP